KQYILTALRKYAHSLEFVGFTQRNQIPDHISDTGIFVIPSIWENYPYVCLEAMSAGKAIIASKNGGMKEILNDVKGSILIDPLNPKEIAKAILLLLQNPKVRVEMGNNNRQKIQAWSHNIIT